MALSLLQVGDHLSLGFDTADIKAIRAYVRDRCADTTTDPAGIATIVRFGGEEITFQNEWDDPCLISASEKGDEMLRATMRILAESQCPQWGAFC